MTPLILKKYLKNDLIYHFWPSVKYLCLLQNSLDRWIVNTYQPTKYSGYSQSAILAIMWFLVLDKILRANQRMEKYPGWVLGQFYRSSSWRDCEGKATKFRRRRFESWQDFDISKFQVFLPNYPRRINSIQILQMLVAFEFLLHIWTTNESFSAF